MEKRQESYPNKRTNSASFSRLQPHEIAQIEEAIMQVQGDGEVSLVVKNGYLRFIEIVSSQPFTPDQQEPADA